MPLTAVSGDGNARQQFLGAQERRSPAFPLTLTTGADVYASVHVHSVAVLPSARSDPRPAVHDRHRHVESRLYRGRAAHRLPAVCWRERGRTARVYHGTARPAASTSPPLRHQTSTLLWCVRASIPLQQFPRHSINRSSNFMFTRLVASLLHFA